MRRKKEAPVDPSQLVPGSREEALYYQELERKTITGFNTPEFHTSNRVSCCKNCACYLETCIYGLEYNGKLCRTHRQAKTK